MASVFFFPIGMLVYQRVFHDTKIEDIAYSMFLFILHLINRRSAALVDPYIHDKRR